MMNEVTQELDAALKLNFYRNIPQRMLPPLRDYLIHGKKPGGFLTAVLCDQLRLAICSADQENDAQLSEWVLLIYNYTPAKCHGSPEAMEEWMAKCRE